MAPNRSQNIPAKYKNTFFTNSKTPIEKSFSGRKHWKNVEKLKKGSKGSTINEKIVRNTQLAKFSLEYNQTWLLATKGTCQFQFLELVQFANPQIHLFEDKNGVIDSKNPVYILFWNQGNYIMGHLWVHTDHNQDHKYPYYGQPVIINIYDQTMISLESCSIYYNRVWIACFCMGGQPGYPLPTDTSSPEKLLFFVTLKINLQIDHLKCPLVHITHWHYQFYQLSLQT